MLKSISQDKYKLILIFFGVFFLQFPVSHFFYNILQIKSTFVPLDQIFSSLNVLSLFIFFIAALWEEFLFRFFLPFQNRIGAVWLVLLSIYFFNKILPGTMTFPIFISILGIMIVLLFITEKFKTGTVYKMLYLSTNFKIIVSVCLFSISHIENYLVDIGYNGYD
jgi:hypothetical protein